MTRTFPAAIGFLSLLAMLLLPVLPVVAAARDPGIVPAPFYFANVQSPEILPALRFAATQATNIPPENPEVLGLQEGIDPASPEALGWTPGQYQAALGYARSGWALAFVSPLYSMGALALLAFTGFAGRLERLLLGRSSSRVPSSRLPSPAGANVADADAGQPAPDPSGNHAESQPPVAVPVAVTLPTRIATDALFIATMVVSLALLNFPLNLYRFYRQHQYGFSNQTFAAWFEDSLKGLFFTGIAAVIFFVPVWAAIRRWPRRWWVAGAVLGVIGAILAIMVTPIWVAPRFNTFTPLPDGELRSRILSLASSQGIPAGEVYEVDASRQSRHDNAYVVGLLGTQRIVLYDTLTQAYAVDEVEFVMGHEMGHYVLNHMWKGIAVAALFMVAGFFLMHRLLDRIIAACGRRLGFTSVGSIAALPLFLLVFSAFLFVARPVNSSISRHFERQADTFALHIFADDNAVCEQGVRAFQRMASRNLSIPDPPAFISWWLYSHPTMGERIRKCAGRE